MNDNPRSAPRFAHGVTLAALVPYVSLLALYRVPGQEPTEYERAHLEFIATIVAFVAYPIFLLLCAAIFGLARLAFRRAGEARAWPFALWGAAASTLVVALQIVLPPRQSLSENAGALAAVAVVGGISGLAFWLGGVRGVRTGKDG